MYEAFGLRDCRVLSSVRFREVAEVCILMYLWLINPHWTVTLLFWRKQLLFYWLKHSLKEWSVWLCQADKLSVFVRESLWCVVIFWQKFFIVIMNSSLTYLRSCDLIWIHCVLIHFQLFILLRMSCKKHCKLLLRVCQWNCFLMLVCYYAFITIVIKLDL